MSSKASPEAVQRARRRREHGRVTGAQPETQRPARSALLTPWAIAGAVAVFILLPRRFKKPVLKAALPLALGLIRAR